MKIKIEKYNPEWRVLFSGIESDLSRHLAFLNPVIEHIGSTSIPGMAAKPIIDILVGIENESDLDKTVGPLIDQGYIFYEKYNSVMPYRRYFIKINCSPESLGMPMIFRASDLAPDDLDDYKIAHIHILELDSYHWKRHIAFRDYLRQNEAIADEYIDLKIGLSALDWESGSEYSEAKGDFIKRIEQEALEWQEGQDIGR